MSAQDAAKRKDYETILANARSTSVLQDRRHPSPDNSEPASPRSVRLPSPTARSASWCFASSAAVRVAKILKDITFRLAPPPRNALAMLDGIPGPNYIPCEGRARRSATRQPARPGRRSSSRYRSWSESTSRNRRTTRSQPGIRPQDDATRSPLPGPTSSHRRRATSTTNPRPALACRNDEIAPSLKPKPNLRSTVTLGLSTITSTLERLVRQGRPTVPSCSRASRDPLSRRHSARHQGRAACAPRTNGKKPS